MEHLTNPDTGEIVPITLVTDNGGPFRSFRFAAFIAAVVSTIANFFKKTG